MNKMEDKKVSTPLPHREGQGGEYSRLISLDVLRGITVAGMILVNDGYGDTYAPLQHAKWNGMTPCDLVFPFFLFIMGISTYLSLRKFNFQWSPQVGKKILKRTLVIFLIGLFINWFDLACDGRPLDFAHLRIWAVMQRIALCYCAASLFALFVNHRYTLPTVAVLLVGYAVVLLCGNGYAYDQTNILARVDLSLFGYDHLYHKSPVDPEGLLGTIPAIAHTLLGFYACKLMAESRDTYEKVLRFLLMGAVMVFAAYLFTYLLPLNKRIWSPTYVLMTCGLCSLLQGILMYVIDIQGRKGWTMPFLVFGVNPLFLYVFSELLAIIFGHTGISDLIYTGIHAVVANTYNASLAYALTFTLICFLVGYPLYKRKIYIKI